MTITSEFQSTRPVRGATHIVLAAHVNANISIHAPRAGRDNTTIKGRTKLINFNPRAPCGARRRRHYRR